MIITRGLGSNSLIITRGYGPSIVVTTDETGTKILKLRAAKVYQVKETKALAIKEVLKWHMN